MIKRRKPGPEEEAHGHGVVVLTRIRHQAVLLLTAVHCPVGLSAVKLHVVACHFHLDKVFVVLCARKTSTWRYTPGPLVADVLRFPNPPPPPPVYRATFFEMVGPAAARITCAVFDTEFGLELRLSYGDDVMRAHLFRGVHRDKRVAETADRWRLALLETGFRDVPL